MPTEGRVHAISRFFNKMGGRDELIKASIKLQDLRRRIYIKAKTEPQWRFWGLYVHVCKMETLQEAYKLARENDGAPGLDGIAFKDIEEQGREGYLQQIQQELEQKTYKPLRNRQKEIPKANSKVRMLGIPSIRDRVVQGALRLILEPIFEADFQDGSYGYRPKRSPHQAVNRVANAITQGKTTVIDLDLAAYFDNVRHHILLEKVAKRINDPDIMHLLKLILKVSGKRGVPQGGVISPLLANIYLTDLDKMLEKAKEVTKHGPYTVLEYARFADDMVVLINGHYSNRWLIKAVEQRTKEELAKLEVELNQEKSRVVDLVKSERFTFLGFQFGRVKSRYGRWRPLIIPHKQKRTQLLRKLSEVIYRFRSQPVRHVISAINPILRGWCNYFRIGHSSRCFCYIRWWVEKKVRQHMQKARKRKGFGWERWSTAYIYSTLGLYNDYKVRYYSPKAKPAR